MGLLNEKEITINDYKEAFNNFHQFIEDFHSNTKNYNIKKSGFIVNLQDYNHLISIINSEIDKNQNIANINNINPPKFKKLIPEKLENINNMILNGKEFIIITEDLCKLICDNNNNRIIYTITDDDKLVIYSENSVHSQKFKNNKKNKINKDSILEKTEINPTNSTLNQDSNLQKKNGSQNI